MPSYMQNYRGTIRKVQGAEPLPNLSIEEQKANELKRHGFIALRIGFSRRQHAERLVRETNEHVVKQQAATLSIVKPPNEARQIAVVTQEGVVTIPADEVAKYDEIIRDAIAPKEDLAS
jgi:hypothetical protein